MMRVGLVGERWRYERDYWDEEFGSEEEMDEDWDDKGRTMISRIYVSFDEVIRSIRFGYLEIGSLVLSKTYGANEGSNFRVVVLDQDEFVTGLSGVREADGGGIRNLTFQTNHMEYLIGRSSHNYPSDSKTEIDPGIRDRREFGGFFGSYSRDYLSSIGMYLCPITGSSLQGG